MSASESGNHIDRGTAAPHLGGTEHDQAPMLKLLCRIEGWQHSIIFLPGAGAARWIDQLLDSGARLILNDLSPAVLAQLKEHLGERATGVEWICQDIADPLSAAVSEIDIWIDRAVLHLLTDESDIDGYFKNLNARLKKGGHVIFVEISPEGPTKCAGLELHRYSVEALAARLGAAFELVDSFDYTYIHPVGDPCPYIYALFERIA